MINNIANGVLSIKRFDKGDESIRWLNEQIQKTADKKAVQTHSIDNPKNTEDVKRIQDNYIDYLYNHYPSLRKLERDVICGLTKQELYNITFPDRNWFFTMNAIPLE